MRKIVIPKPFDAHMHLRQGEWLRKFAPIASRIFSALVAMGNLQPPIVDAVSVKNYHQDILLAGANFETIMTLMLVNSTTPEIVDAAYRVGARALKLIPGGASTNSQDGVALENLVHYYPVFAKARELDMLCLFHWELPIDPMTGQEIPELLRETAALPYFRHTIVDIPGLKIVGEHLSTRQTIEFVKRTPNNVAATLALQHGLITYNDVFGRSTDGEETIVKNPLFYCKPVAKNEEDRLAVVGAMISGNPKFFFGSDSAPHPIQKKASPNPAAGIFTLPEVLIGKLCEIFEEHDALKNFPKFVSENGRKFYGLRPSRETITLVKEDWIVPESFHGVRLFLEGQRVKWKVVS